MPAAMPSLSSAAALLVLLSMTCRAWADPSRRLNPTRPKAFDYAADAERVVGQLNHNFSCDGLEYGYYADQGQKCQVFHICMPVKTATGRILDTFQFSFFCPNQTRFSQDSRTCINEAQAYPCHKAHTLYDLNKAIGHRPNKKKKKRPVNLKEAQGITKPISLVNTPISSPSSSSIGNTVGSPISQGFSTDDSFSPSLSTSSGLPVQDSVTPVHTDSAPIIGSPAVAIPSSGHNTGSTNNFAGRSREQSKPTSSGVSSPNKLPEVLEAPDFIIPPGSQIISTKSLQHQNAIANPTDRKEQNSNDRLSTINVSSHGSSGISNSQSSATPQSFTAGTTAAPASLSSIGSTSSINSIESSTPHSFTTLDSFTFSKIAEIPHTTTENIAFSSVSVNNRGSSFTSTEPSVSLRPIPQRDRQPLNARANNRQPSSNVKNTNQVEKVFSNSHTLEAATGKGTGRLSSTGVSQISTFADRARAHTLQSLNHVNNQRSSQTSNQGSSSFSFSQNVGNERKPASQFGNQQLINSTPQPLDVTRNFAPQLSQKFTPPPTTAPITNQNLTPLHIPGFSAGVIRRNEGAHGGSRASISNERQITQRPIIQTTTENFFENEEYQTTVETVTPFEVSKTQNINTKFTDHTSSDDHSPRSPTRVTVQRRPVQGSSLNQFSRNPSVSGNRASNSQTLRSQHVNTFNSGRQNINTASNGNHQIPTKKENFAVSIDSGKASSVSNNHHRGRISSENPRIINNQVARPSSSSQSNSNQQSSINSFSTQNIQQQPVNQGQHLNTVSKGNSQTTIDEESLALSIDIGKIDSVSSDQLSSSSFRKNSDHHSSRVSSPSPRISNQVTRRPTSFPQLSSHRKSAVTNGSTQNIHQGSVNRGETSKQKISTPQTFTSEQSLLAAERSHKNHEPTTKNKNAASSTERSRTSASRGLRVRPSSENVGDQLVNPLQEASGKQESNKRGSIRRLPSAGNSATTRNITRNRGSRKFQPPAYLLQSLGQNSQSSIRQTQSNRARSSHSRTHSGARSENSKTSDQSLVTEIEANVAFENERNFEKTSSENRFSNSNKQDGKTANRNPSNNNRAAARITSDIPVAQIDTVPNTRGRNFGPRNPSTFTSNNILSAPPRIDLEQGGQRLQTEFTTEVPTTTPYEFTPTIPDIGRLTTPVSIQATTKSSFITNAPRQRQSSRSQVRTTTSSPSTKSTALSTPDSRGRKVIKKKIIVNGRPGSRRNSESNSSSLKPEPQQQAISPEEEKKRQRALEALARFDPRFANANLLAVRFVSHKPKKNEEGPSNNQQHSTTEASIKRKSQASNLLTSQSSQRSFDNQRRVGSRRNNNNAPASAKSTTTAKPRNRSRLNSRRLSRPVSQPTQTTEVPKTTSAPRTVSPFQRVNSRSRQRLSKNENRSEKVTKSSDLASSSTPATSSESQRRGDTKFRNSVSNRRRVLKKVTPISGNSSNLSVTGSSSPSISSSTDVKSASKDSSSTRPSGQLRVVGTSIESSVSSSLETKSNDRHSSSPASSASSSSASRFNSQRRTSTSSSSRKSTSNIGKHEITHEPLTDLELEALSALAQVNSAFGEAARFQPKKVTSPGSPTSSLRTSTPSRRRNLNSSRSRSRSR